MNLVYYSDFLSVLIYTPQNINLIRKLRILFIFRCLESLRKTEEIRNVRLNCDVNNGLGRKLTEMLVKTNSYNIAFMQ